MARELYVGVHIEGVAGTTGGTTTNGDLFVSDVPSFALVGYDLVAVEVDIPAPISSQIDWRTGDYNLSAMDALLQLTDEVALMFVRKAVDTTAVLNAAITSASASVQIKPSGSATNNAYAWIGDEAVYLSGISVGADFDTFTIARAQAHTTAVAHAADDLVYDRPQYWAGRMVRVIVIDDLGNSDVIWSGYLVNRSIDSAHTEITLSAEELLSSLGKSSFGKSSQVLRPYSNVSFNYWGTAMHGTVDYPDDYTRILPARDQMIFHVEGDFGNVVVPGSRVAAIGPGISLVGGVMFADGPALERRNQRVPVLTRFYEIIYMNNNGSDTGTFQTRTVAGAVVSDVIYEPWHPASIILAFLLSTGTATNNIEDPDSPGNFLTYDVLREDYGLGIPHERIDGASFVGIIRDEPVEIDQLIVGAGGDEPDVLELIFTIARSYGWVLAPDLSGRLALRKIRTLSVTALGSMTAASTIMLPGDDGAELLPLDFGERESVARLRGTVGQTAFRDGMSVQTTPQNLTRAETLALSGRGDQYDYPTWDPGRRSTVLSDLKAKSRLRREGPPRANTRCTYTHGEAVAGFTGTSTVAPLGEYVRLLRDPDDDSFSIMGPDGVYVDPNDDANFLVFTGWVSSLTLNAGDHNVDLGVELFGWKAKNLVRLIAPSGAIDAYDGGAKTITLDAAALLSRDQDHGFVVGDEVVVRWANGTIWESSALEIRSITAISGDIITLDSAYTNTPPAGEDAYGDPKAFLELADYDNFTNTSWAPAFLPATWANTRYAYIGDATDTLGAANVTADIYGID